MFWGGKMHKDPKILEEERDKMNKRFTEHNEQKESKDGADKLQTKDEINYHVSKQHYLHIVQPQEDDKYQLDHNQFIYLQKEHKKNQGPDGRIEIRVVEEKKDKDDADIRVDMNNEQVDEDVEKKQKTKTCCNFNFCKRLVA